MPDFLSQLRALGDSGSVQYGVVSTVVAAVGTLARPVLPSESGWLPYRTGLAAFTALELSAWPRDGRQEIPTLPIRIGMAAGGAALMYRFAGSAVRVDGWLENKVRSLGSQRPRIVMALGAGALSISVFVLERRTNRRYEEDHGGRMAGAVGEPDQQQSTPWEEPCPAHRRLYAGMVSVSEEYGPVLEAQFAHSRVRRSEHCDHGCFDIVVTADTPRIPRKTECPIAFNAIDQATGADDNVMLLVWHRNGLVDGVEISWFEGDAHPPPELLTVFE
ncbi:hypothetical protein [Arthrobacter monumenti]